MLKVALRDYYHFIDWDLLWMDCNEGIVGNIAHTLC